MNTPLFLLILAVIIATLQPVSATARTVSFLQSQTVETHPKARSKKSFVISNDITVVDGDTLKTKKYKIRLWGIDALELKQSCTKNQESFPCGEIAKKIMESIVSLGPVTCIKIDMDRYQRIVAQCNAANGFDIGLMMVELGWALDYSHYSKGFYTSVQENAEREHRGVWATQFEKPWEWRHDNKMRHRVQ